MTLVGFKARNHRQQVGRRGALSVVDNRATAPEWFAALDERFGFTSDVAASAENAKCRRYFDEASDGLRQPWAGERVWCNPPFSMLPRWAEKAHRESYRTPLIVMCVPANRTEQDWWQRWIEPYRDRGRRLRVEFVRGRQRFIHPDADTIGKNERPPFGVCLLIWAAPERTA